MNLSCLIYSLRKFEYITLQSYSYTASGVLLRCDVFVDTVHRIEIATTTRELLLGESPEVFDVFGYDEEG